METGGLSSVEAEGHPKSLHQSLPGNCSHGLAHHFEPTFAPRTANDRFKRTFLATWMNGGKEPKPPHASLKPPLQLFHRQPNLTASPQENRRDRRVKPRYSQVFLNHLRSRIPMNPTTQTSRLLPAWSRDVRGFAQSTRAHNLIKQTFCENLISW